MGERKADMHRHLGIRGKVLAVLALPVLVLAGASAAVVTDAHGEVDRARQTRVVSDGIEQLTRLQVALEAERSASVQAVTGDAVARARIADLRTGTDLAVSAVDRMLGGWSLDGLPDAARRAVAGVGVRTGRLPAIRDGVDAALAGTSTTLPLDAAAGSPTLDGYTRVISALVDLPGVIAGTLSDRGPAAGLESAAWLGRAAEALSRERLAGLQLLAAGGAGPAVRGELAAAQEQRTQSLTRLRAVASPEVLTALDQALAGPNGAQSGLDDLAARLVAAPVPPLAGVDSDGWSKLTDAQALALQQLAGQVAGQTASRSAQAVDDALTRVALILAAAVLLVGLSVLLALMQSRRITAPLRRLTAAATELAGDLPVLVARTQAGDPAPDAPDPVVRGRDEVARLAEAFRDVHATTLEVAHEQAELRAVVSDMFVNVARRNQVLLSRLLAFIDRLERGEEDPDILNNLFRLDHLATRMRRNAESLLVLAGADSGRRLRSAMPLSDVLRTAVSEVEHYERVRITLGVDSPVVGHLALATAHLFAELIENATNFSEPGSPVTIASYPTDSGVRVTITDLGIGMPAEDLARVNARLAEPAATEAMGSQRLGFFVVGRLAARLESRVRLIRSDERGTVVTVELSPALFLPGSLDGSSSAQETAGTAVPAGIAAATGIAVPADTAVPAAPVGAGQPRALAATTGRPPALGGGSAVPDGPGTEGLRSGGSGPEGLGPEGLGPEPVGEAVAGPEPDTMELPPIRLDLLGPGTARPVAPEPVAPEPVAVEPVAAEPVAVELTEVAEPVAVEPVAPESVAGSQPAAPPDWQDLLHQRQPRIRMVPVADPLSPNGWLTSDAWVDAPDRRNDGTGRAGSSPPSASPTGAATPAGPASPATPAGPASPATPAGVAGPAANGSGTGWPTGDEAAPPQSAAGPDVAGPVALQGVAGPDAAGPIAAQGETTDRRGETTGRQAGAAPVRTSPGLVWQPDPQAPQRDPGAELGPVGPGGAPGHKPLPRRVPPLPPINQPLEPLRPPSRPPLFEVPVPPLPESLDPALAARSVPPAAPVAGSAVTGAGPAPEAVAGGPGEAGQGRAPATGAPAAGSGPPTGPGPGSPTAPGS
ncbi:MAG TPA: nitrate- and nitrite sensing domain-containing protein, partial [Kineosporiaceae bacterium]|nr:nitrate- and nitrite sensing domain-containing protein [Kineosporiaceae bacterium]